jgi:hypothetical protein
LTSRWRSYIKKLYVLGELAIEEKDFVVCRLQHGVKIYIHGVSEIEG